MTVLQASDYPKFKSIPRLHRRVVISEKIDGTNGLIDVIDHTSESIDRATSSKDVIEGASIYGTDPSGNRYLIRAGSRNRWLAPQSDNHGFFAWMAANADALAELGPGRHYGEWFGKGIQSGYGLDEKRFALFNTSRWYDPRHGYNLEYFLRDFPKAVQAPAVVTTVPVLMITDGKTLNAAVAEALHTLESQGSFIAPGFMEPEGVVIYHEAAGTYFKSTIKNDESPKSLAGAK